MLVLSRKLTERIHVGSRVIITVLQIEGNRVRIGIDAPPEVHVLRSELLPTRRFATLGGLARDRRR